MATFKHLNVQKYKRTFKTITPDTKYWQRLSPPTMVREFGAIDYIDFNPTEPNFAVTCSLRVQIYNPFTKLVIKNLSRFQVAAYGGNFRRDGRLLIAGDDQGIVHLFDTSSRNILRLYKGHKAPVHRTFFTANLLQIASFSDDCTVRIWDIVTEKVVQTYADNHTDYIRAGAMHPTSTDILISGGYDGKIKVYDTRMANVTRTVSVDSPIESLMFLPSGGIFVSAAATQMCAWDLFAGGRILAKMSQHRETITSLCLGLNGRRILSASLDRHIKIYDVSTYEVVHTLRYPNSILSVGVAAMDQAVVAGMVDGLVHIQTMKNRSKVEDNEVKRKVSISVREKPIFLIDHVIKNVEPNTKLRNFDKFFRYYEYRKALNCVLTKHNIINRPEVIVAVIQELTYRQGLHRALSNLDEITFRRLINFLERNISEHRFMRILVNATNAFIDVYMNSYQRYNKNIIKGFERLGNALKQDIALTKDMLKLEGSLEMLISATSVKSGRGEMFNFVE